MSGPQHVKERVAGQNVSRREEPSRKRARSNCSSLADVAYVHVELLNPGTFQLELTSPRKPMPSKSRHVRRYIDTKSPKKNCTADDADTRCGRSLRQGDRYSRSPNSLSVKRCGVLIIRNTKSRHNDEQHKILSFQPNISLFGLKT